MSDNLNVLLVGTGYMAKEYSKVLRSMNISHMAVCKNEASADSFYKETGVKALPGGIERAFFRLASIPKMAIVAVSIEQLANTAIFLIKNGVKKILIEKPAGLNKKEVANVLDISNQFHSTVYVAYNRRFYASVEKAMQFIKEDDGVSSFNFEFTEWGFRIADSSHSSRVKEEWLLANSSHVIDLAFFLGGYPQKMCSFSSGSLQWHSKASKYSGAGITDKGITFSYQANWDAPGRWSVEILTREHRLYLKPMEKLYIQNKGTVEIEEVHLDDKIDMVFKPGIYRQTKAFLSTNMDYRLLLLEDHVKHLNVYEQIECFEGVRDV